MCGCPTISFNSVSNLLIVSLYFNEYISWLLKCAHISEAGRRGRRRQGLLYLQSRQFRITNDNLHSVCPGWPCQNAGNYIGLDNYRQFLGNYAGWPLSIYLREGARWRDIGTEKHIVKGSSSLLLLLVKLKIVRAFVPSNEMKWNSSSVVLVLICYSSSASAYRAHGGMNWIYRVSSSKLWW